MKRFLKGNLHTHTKNSDGRNTLEEMINRYKELGYDFVAITDHNKFTKISHLDGKGIVIFEGCEHSRGEHWNEIRGEKEVLRIKNHPMRYSDSCREIDLSNFDVHEATEHARLYPKYILCGKKSIYTDDSHNINMCGKAWILVEVEEPITKDKILRAIKNGKYTLGGIL